MVLIGFLVKQMLNNLNKKTEIEVKDIIDFNVSFWYTKNHKDLYNVLSGRYCKFLDKKLNKLDYYYNFNKVYIDGKLKSPEYLHTQFKKDFKLFDTFYKEIKKHYPDIDFVLDKETSNEQTNDNIKETPKE